MLPVKLETPSLLGHDMGRSLDSKLGRINGCSPGEEGRACHKGKEWGYREWYPIGVPRGSVTKWVEMKDTIYGFSGHKLLGVEHSGRCAIGSPSSALFECQQYLWHCCVNTSTKDPITDRSLLVLGTRLTLCMLLVPHCCAHITTGYQTKSVQASSTLLLCEDYSAGMIIQIINWDSQSAEPSQ